MQLTNIIIQKIKLNGPISFHDFMEMALYYPELGYYTSKGEKIGTEGDFYTSSDLSPVFGAMVAKQLEEIWQIMGTKTFTVVEYGAGNGSLCENILNYFKKDIKLFENFYYCIIEKSQSLRDKQKIHLNGNIRWVDKIQDLDEIEGCVISNELVDNFAVHLVEMHEELMEIFIDYQTNKFIEILKPASDKLKNYLDELKVTLPNGFRTEINLEAIGWLQDIAQSLNKGYIITIDYGFTSDELYSDRRRQGTLLCYNKHQINDDVYNDIGKQDITAHVNFSALSYWGQKAGLDYCGFTNQANFLLALGFKDYFRNINTNGKNIMQMALEETRITRTLLLDLGLKIKVLVQKKGVRENSLTGLKHPEKLISA
ncbi:MAG: SAM-dependent methyltransferase [Chitinophagaceae bacterium]|nr:SAM-dependent methyltransferase [Chitinophagaceae bacterium]